MDNMKISEILTNPNPEINRTTQSSNDTFKFMLVSNIAEQELQQKIGGLMSQIDEQGKRFPKERYPGYETLPGTDKGIVK